MKEDVVWRLEAYRLGLFLSDACWEDSQKNYSIKAILFSRSIISLRGFNKCKYYRRLFQNIEKRKARFYEISLGSAREARDWYFKSRHAISYDLAYTRIKMLTSIIKLLQSMISDQRRKSKSG